jgi:cysteine sulfinate desulfinase/cysteine desulfurase-like protein
VICVDDSSDSLVAVADIQRRSETSNIPNISVDGAKNKNNLRKLGQQLCVGVGSECTNAVYGIIYRKGGTLEAASVVFIDDVEMP